MVEEMVDVKDVKKEFWWDAHKVERLADETELSTAFWLEIRRDDKWTES